MWPHKISTCVTSTVFQFLLLLSCCNVGISFALAPFHSDGVCSSTPIGQDASLTCSIKTLDEDTLVASLVEQPLDTVASLTLRCNQVYYFQSVLTKSNLDGFPRLRDLTVEYCKLSQLDESAFEGLSGLRNLTLRTHNSEWPAISLSAPPSVFRPLQQLEQLDLSTNNIWEMPHAFCHLTNLRWLNLSHNHLQDLSQLGWGQSEITRCSSGNSITTLDLSYNDVTMVLGGALHGLGGLQRLLLQHNDLAKLDDHALLGLSELASLDLSHNRLVALPEDIFLPTPSLMELRVRNNSLSGLAPGLLSGLLHLVELDLSHNDLQSEWLTSSIFQGLIRLLALDLSHNQISHLNQQVFRDLSNVQFLQLSHNKLKVVPNTAFATCINLHRLDLSNNQLTTISNNAFQGVNVLSFLSLDNNKINIIGARAFSNLTSLKDLNLNGNKLNHFPKALGNLKNIETLDLGENQLTTLQDMPVKGLMRLYGLRLVNNNIAGNITKDSFNDIPSLRILNLANNGINEIEKGTFDQCYNLQAIRLDANNIVSIHGLFEKIPNLQWLNVSDNNIEIFDYYFIPVSLEWLDIHKNKISKLDNYMERQGLNLQTLDASFNNIQYINQIMIPDSVELLFLNDNRLTIVEPFTFFKKANLSRVDLFDNQISTMDMSALRLSPVPKSRELPKFYLGGNPFVCDCKMEWLQRINNLDQLERQHPKLMDIDSMYCQLSFARTGTFVSLVDVEPSQFLCQYESHCFALCHCCEYDACDCEMTCPEGCRCYHDQAWHNNIVDCSNQDAVRVPDRIPMDVTQAYLDGNNLKNLSPHAFIGRKHLQNLYINNSKVHYMDNETFSGLTRLIKLHLNDNVIGELRGNEFHGLEVLRELYLHNNQLRYIHQHTFATLLHLEVLTLHNNKLINFPVWRLVDNPYLIEISLSDNQWSCECQFVESFDIWISSNERKAIDSNEIMCSETETFIIEFNLTTCTNRTLPSTIIQPMVLNGLLNPVIGICIAFIVIVLMLLCILFRGSIRVWLYTQCGCRVCHSHAGTEDCDKLYDAFVSYSAKDEAWVTQVLSGELQHGDKPYRVCLHYRDFPVTAYIAESILEACDSSKRTIIVLSKNFIENEWCKFQFKSAHQEVLKNHHNRMIVIVLGEIPTRDLDPDLQLYLKINTVIHTSEKLFWEKLKFAMPDVPLNQKDDHIYSSIPDRTHSFSSNKFSVNRNSINENRYSVNSPAPIHANIHQSNAYYA